MPSRKSPRYKARAVKSTTLSARAKPKPVAIYEILDYHNEQTFPNIVEVLTLFKNGLNKYRKRQ
jgi:adenylate cyclase